MKTKDTAQTKAQPEQPTAATTKAPVVQTAEPLAAVVADTTTASQPVATSGTTAPAACCGTEKQQSCCAPSAKASCCGAQAAPSSCGCK